MGGQLTDTSSKEEIIQRVKARAYVCDECTGCSQRALQAVQKELGIGSAETFRAATVLAGGLLHGESCGALIGALMGLGLALGNDKKVDDEAVKKVRDIALEVIERFKQELQRQFGFKQELKSTLCKDIQERVLGKYFGDDHEGFLKAGGKSENGCPKVSSIAAQVVAEKILKVGETQKVS